MPRETNFVELYRLLDLKPDCELGAFKQAYRRRVAVLHPDRRGRSATDKIASERLQHLTALYSSAIEFERRHGRLPGALQVRRPGAAANVSTASAPPTSMAAANAPPHNARKLWAGLALAIVAAWLIWSPPWQVQSTNSDSPTAMFTSTADAEQERVDTLPPGVVHIGATTGAVRAIEGEPILINGNRWEYGPSWIYFQDGTVVDWYSSPLHPLETATAHPQPDEK